MGSMHFDDSQFCRQIYTILQGQVGLCIKDIGDLDLSHTL